MQNERKTYEWIPSAVALNLFSHWGTAFLTRSLSASALKLSLAALENSSHEGTAFLTQQLPTTGPELSAHEGAEFLTQTLSAANWNYRRMTLSAAALEDPLHEGVAL